jgi:hypothetical protein
MASRREVREAFYSELETAADGLVPPSNIGQQYPEAAEDLPTIVHNDNYRPVPMNRGAAPVEVVDNNDGTSTEYYVTMMEAQFTLTVLSESEDTKEDIYEAVRSYFEPFEHPFKDTSDIQEDVHEVGVTDSNSNDQTDREPVARVDTLRINLGFKRLYGDTNDHVTDIEHEVDIDGDGTAENTYTTT